MASILNDIQSLIGSRSLGNTEKAVRLIQTRLATGSRINQASDDAAGLQISNNLRADLRILNRARQNAFEGIGITSVADGALEQGSQLLERAAEIATQAASGTTSADGRKALNEEFQQILQSLDDLGVNTKFGDKQVFGDNLSIQVGDETVQDVEVTSSGLSSSGLGLGGGSLATATDAETALGNIQSAIESISSRRGEIGAIQKRLDTTINQISINIENTTAAESQIRDADLAEEIVNLTKFQILQQSGTKSLSQANLNRQNILSLLR